MGFEQIALQKNFILDRNQERSTVTLWCEKMALIFKEQIHSGNGHLFGVRPILG